MSLSSISAGVSHSAKAASFCATRSRTFPLRDTRRFSSTSADVTYIDSSGIGELVSAFTSVRNAGGDLKLLKLTKKVHDLLQITKLYTVFDILDDEASAVSAFSRSTGT